MGLYYTGFEVSYYRNHILLGYVVLVVVSYIMYRRRFNVSRSLGLAFLTIYLNSFYWELPMHVADLFSHGVYPAMAHQLWRLSPYYIFYREFSIRSAKYLQAGLVVSSLVFWYTFYLGAGHPYKMILFHINRLICAYLLTRTFVEANHKYNLMLDLPL